MHVKKVYQVKIVLAAALTNSSLFGLLFINGANIKMMNNSTMQKLMKIVIMNLVNEVRKNL